MILIVDDEVKIANLLRDYLNNSGYTTTAVYHGDDVMKEVKKSKPDLILLDIMIPGKDGLSLCKEIKEHHDIPIILISARTDEVDRIIGLELGADDYICKPFSPREVVARVKARLRDAPNIESSVPGLRIDDDKKLVWLDEKKIDLTPVEYRLLHTLAKHSGYPVSREIILDNLYEDKRIVSDRTVDSHIKNLKRKLLDVRDDENFLKSVYGRGYQIG